MRNASLLILAFSLAASVALAQPAASPDGGIDSRIQLRDIDRATVRVITIRGVEPTVFHSQETRVHRLVADPDAAHGSGFFVDANGIIATAAHVTAGANLIAVILAGQADPIPAQVVHVDAEHDVAFLRVAATPPAIVTVPTSQRRLNVAEAVFSSGFPLDVRERYPVALSGVLGRENNDGSLYTSLAVNPGNSGGPVVDAQGQLLGLVSRGSNTRAGAQGFGLLEPVRFIIPGLVFAREFSTTRFDPPTPQERVLARVLADLLGTDTERRLFERTPFDVIVAAGTPPSSPEAAMVVAAHAWNMHVALLEHHRVRDVSQLATAEQAQASQLRALAVRLIRDAFSAAPYLRANHSFGRSVLVQEDRSFVIRGAR